MFRLTKKLLITFLVLLLFTTACEEFIDAFSDFYAPSEWFGLDETIIDEDQVQADPPIQIERQEAEPTPTVIVIEQQPEVQGCFWHNYEISPPAESTSNPAYEIDTGEPFAITTIFTHGISSCEDQYFKTLHSWSDVSPVMWPGKNISYWVRMEWENIGSRDCSALVAGASTHLSIDDFRLKASEESINVKSDPFGSREDSSTWAVPEGKEGDTFTLSVQAITGSYGGTTRYRFKYSCNLTVLEDYEGFSAPPALQPTDDPQPVEPVESEPEEQPVEPVDDQPEPDVESPEVSPPDSDYDWPSSSPTDYDISGSLLGPLAVIGALGALGVVGVVGVAVVAILAGMLKGGGATGAASAGIPKRGSTQNLPRGQNLPENFIQSSQFGGPSDNPNINYDHQDDECRPF